MRPCQSCQVPTIERELVAGCCLRCIDEEGGGPIAEVEAAAVEACRRAGLRAIPREIPEAIRGPVAPRRREAPRRSAAFGEFDQMRLEAYFQTNLPPAAWDRSTFGAQIQKSGEAINPNAVQFTTCAAHALAAGPRRRMEPKKRLEWLRGVRWCQTCRETARPIGSVSPSCPICDLPLTEEHQRRKEFSKGSSRLRDPHRRKERLEFLNECGRHAGGVRSIEVDDHLVDVTVLRPVRTPEVLVSEELDSHGAHGAGKFGSWEEQMASYLDARLAWRRVHMVLARLPRWARDALEARYSESEEQSASTRLGELAGVGLLTDSAKGIRDELAANGKVGTVREMLAGLTKAANGRGPDAGEASLRIARIRRDAEQLVEEAHRAYARVSTKLWGAVA